MKLSEKLSNEQMLRKKSTSFLLVPVEHDSDNLEKENGDIRPKKRIIPNIGKSSVRMRETFVSLMKSRSSLRIEEDDSGSATLHVFPIKTLRGDEMKRRDNLHEFINYINLALFTTGCPVKV